MAEYKVANTGYMSIPYSFTSGSTVQTALTYRDLYSNHSYVVTQDNPLWTLWFLRERFAGKRHIGGKFEVRSIRTNLGLGCRVRDMKTKQFAFSNPWGYQSTAMLLPSAAISSALGTYSSADSLDQYAAKIQRQAPTPLTASMLDAAGATAVGRCIPTNPLVDLSTSVAETISARKLFSLPGKNNGVAGEYLNFQLGIVPVLSDVKDTWQAAEKQETVIKQFERDAGRLIRRRYEFPEITDTESVKTTGVRPVTATGQSVNPYLVETGELSTFTTTSQSTWFSGAFTYHLPQERWRRDLAYYHKLYGIKPGLETAYNVVPYSFVADYFANLGDVIHNLDAFLRDGLVMPYGYIMCTQRVHEVHTWTGNVKDAAGAWNRVTLQASVTKVTKQRRLANPFGFGLTYESLTPRQVSILAALGVSRR